MKDLAIFKRYDIRGKFPSEVNEENAKLLAQAYFSLLKPTDVVVGHDSVVGSDKVCLSFAKTLVDLGVNVTSVGMVSSPMLYFSSNYLGVSLAFMFTASHLGEGFTGIKPLREGIPLSQEEMALFKKTYNEGVLVENPLGTKGKYLETDISAVYIEKILSLFDHPISKLKISVDAGNGPNSPVFEKIYQALKIPYVAINNDLRQTGLAHASNPKIAENRRDLLQNIKSEKTDLGVIWDGDCDRAYFLDREGQVISPEFVAILIAKKIKESYGYPKITVDIRGSSAVEIESFKFGVSVKRIMAWHIPIKEEMVKDPEIGFGFETSGHYVFRDFYKIDDGILASLMFIDALSNLPGDYMDELTAFRKNYYILEEVNFETKKTESALQDELKKIYPDGQLNLIDGISVEYPSWRFNVRASRSEPIIRLNVSGLDKVVVDREFEKLKKIIVS